mmetsp:Transcript_123986/g.246887  ORF Transcript_123986/g.246887 Transcript_123986/m.246887 type:complete len:227 (-) Transcript_123986:57-737(-)
MPSLSNSSVRMVLYVLNISRRFERPVTKFVTNDSSESVAGRSARTSREPCLRPSSMAATNSPPAVIPLFVMVAYTWPSTVLMKKAPAATAKLRGSQNASLLQCNDSGCGGVTTSSPSSSSVPFISFGILAASISSTTESGWRSCTMFRTLSASDRVTWEVPISASRLPRKLSHSINPPRTGTAARATGATCNNWLVMRAGGRATRLHGKRIACSSNHPSRPLHSRH